MKRIAALLLIFAVICGGYVFAEDSDETPVNSSYNMVTGNLVIEGATEIQQRDDITVLVVDKNISRDTLKPENVHYFNTFSTDDNGIYNIKFNISPDMDINNLDVIIKQGASDITRTLKSAVFQRIMNVNAHYAGKKIYADISKIFSSESDFTLIVSSYDDEGKLISAKTNDVHLNYEDYSKNLSIDYDMPDKATSYKVFAWESINALSPLTDVNEKQYNNANASVLSIYSDDDIRETADELFGNINPDSEDIKYIYDEYKDGNYLNALALFRNYMIDNLRKTPADISGCAWNDNYGNTIALDLLDTMVGYMTLDEANGGVRTTEDKCGILNYIDSDKMSHCDWIVCDETFTSGGTILLDNLRHGFTGLAIRYMQTGDTAYAKKAMQLMEDYALNYPSQSDEHFGLSGSLESRSMKSVDRSAHTDYTDVLVINDVSSMSAGYNVSKAQRASSFFYAMAYLAKALPAENFVYEYGVSYPVELSKMSFTDKLSDDSYNIIDPVRWARWIDYIAEWDFPVICGSAIDFGSGIPNIKSSSYQASLRYMALLKDFKVADTYKTRLFDAVNSFYPDSTHPDGIYIEKAFNYNIGEATNRNVTASVIKNIVPEWYTDLYNFTDNNTKWENARKILTSPLGLLAHVGNYSGATGTSAVWTDAKLMQQLQSSLNITPEDYTSAYLPYSGLGAFRSGWETDDLYMSFFVNKDRYQGHSFPATNAIMNLSAYGRTMLISGGNPWYGRNYVQSYTDFLESGYDEINGYMSEASSKKFSTVLVNGKSQEDYEYSFDENGVTSTWGTSKSEAKDETIESKWVSDSNFDYVEGTYDNAYTVRDSTDCIIPELPDKEAITKDAEHTRRFVFVREAGLWIVADEMKNTNDNPNTYSSMWHFAPYEEGSKKLTGFKNEQVIVNETNNSFYTNDTGKLNYSTPNLFAYNFSDKKLSYKKYYGYYSTGDRQAFGWSFGGTDIVTGNYAKRPEVHVEWSDGGMGDITQTATVLIPSPDKNTRLSYKIDNSTENTTSFEIGLNNGCIITYTSNPDGCEKNIGNDKIVGKTIITVQKNALSKVNGMVIDCDSINDIPDGTSFTFGVSSSEIVKSKNIERPMN